MAASGAGTSAPRPAPMGDGTAKSIASASVSQIKVKRGRVEQMEPDSFDPLRAYYPRASNATIHPLVLSFINMKIERIARRYCHLHPECKEEDLLSMLRYKPRHFRWGGCDTFSVVTAEGTRRACIVETNSCPSGCKSMPLLRDAEEEGAYKRLLETTFGDLLDEEATEKNVPGGILAVVYDKNRMEASSYAAVLSDLAKEPVFLVEFYLTDDAPPVRWTADGVMEVRVSQATRVGGGGGVKKEGDGGTEESKASEEKEEEWKPVRAAFRYVTQRPWTRFPIKCKTRILNPLLPCLAGGRNKAMGAVAYELLNSEMETKGIGLKIRTPETCHSARKHEVPLWIKRFGGHGVVKVPFLNAGQGVYTILNKAELNAFMEDKHYYSSYIVQSLIGHSAWSSRQRDGTFYHTGTVPDRHNRIFVADLRMMVSATKEGYRPLAAYARRAAEPLTAEATSKSSWSMLGTNLSKLQGDLEWTSETDRLLLMDRKDFNTLGLGLDDLIDGYVQTVLSMVAIDKMCVRLVDKTSGEFNYRLFHSLCGDSVLFDEIMDNKVASRTALGVEAMEMGVSADTAVEMIRQDAPLEEQDTADVAAAEAAAGEDAAVAAGGGGGAGAAVVASPAEPPVVG